MPSTTDRDRTLKLARRRQGVTARDLAAAGIHRQVLSRLVESGELERVVRGVYRLPEHPLTENHGLAMASAVVPHGVICLLSALQFHGIGTQLPSEVWIAIDRRARRPALKYPPLRVVRYSGERDRLLPSICVMCSARENLPRKAMCKICTFPAQTNRSDSTIST